MSIALQTDSESFGPDFQRPRLILEALLDSQKKAAMAVLERFHIDRSSRPRILWLICIWAFAVLLSLDYVVFPTPPVTPHGVAVWACDVLLVLITLGIFVSALMWSMLNIFVYGAVALYFCILAPFNLVYLGLCTYIGHRRREKWINRYKFGLSVGFASAVCLAFMYDMDRSFWERIPTIATLVRTTIFALCAWGSIVCSAIGNKVDEPETPAVLLKWTLSIVVIVGFISHSVYSSELDRHQLEQAVVAAPRQQQPWIDLGMEYVSEAERLAADQGDNDPPDPTPSYRAAEECLLKAEALGGLTYDSCATLAKVADAVGDVEVARAHAVRAIQIRPSDSSAEDVDDLARIAKRSSPEPTANQRRSEDLVTVKRIGRINDLPFFTRWAFELPVVKGLITLMP
ncbi:MAG: hypothetical protein JSS72_08410 [Armatimonadetes bacterium]|nr:hypothetical protein [Armatimonadota bacterium]